MPSSDHIIGAFANAVPQEFWSLFFLQLKHHFEYMVGQNNPKIVVLN